MPRPALAVLVCLLIAGIAATAWWASGSDPRSATAGPGAEAERAAAQPGSGEIGAARADETAGEPEASRIALEEQQHAPSAPEAAKPPAAHGQVVTGVVHDPSGRPLAGARVLARSVEAAFLAGGPPLDARTSWGGPRPLEATTGADGRFEIAGMRPGNLRIAVRAPKCSPYDDDQLVLPAGERHDVGTIALLASPVVDGRVVDSRGRPVAGAELARSVNLGGGIVLFEAGPGRPRVPLATTAEDGTFLLDQVPAGPFQLSVTSEAHPDQTVPIEPSAPGARISNLRVVLEDGFEISGTVVGAPEGQTSELRVVASVHRGDSFAPPDGAFPAGESRSAQLGTDGSFLVRGLRENKQYDLIVRRNAGDGYLPFGGRLSSRVTARAGDRGVEIAYQPESGISLTVVDASTKAPVETYHLEAGIDYRIPVAEPGQRGDQHPQGKARVGNLRPRGPDARASLAIEATGYRRFEMADIALVEGGDVDLGVLELEPAPVVRVTVLDAVTAKPVSGARVTLQRKVEDDPRGGVPGRRVAVRSVAFAPAASAGGDTSEIPFFGGEDSHGATTDVNGVAVVSSFESERCELLVRHREHAPFRSEPFVCAAGGPEEREVRLLVGGSARVKLVRTDGTPVAGGRVLRRDAGSGSSPFDMFGGDGNSRAVTDANGECVFQHLAPGTHSFKPDDGDLQGGFVGGDIAVRIADDGADQGSDWVDAAVADRAEVQVTLTAPVLVALRGQVREAGEPLAGASLQLSPKRGDGGPPMPFLLGGPSARTDGRGRYEIANVKGGDYVLTVTHPRRQMPAEFDVHVGDSDEDVDVDLQLAIVEGRVFGPDGKPLSDVRVSVARDEPRERGGRRTAMRMLVTADGGGDSEMTMFDGPPGTVARTDEEGRYTLRGVQTDVDLVVRAEAKDSQPAKSDPFKLRDGEIKSNVDLRLALAGKVEVSTFRAGAPVGMVSVQAWPEGGSSNGPDTKNNFVPQSGKTTLDGLAPGKWIVQVRSLGVPGENFGGGSQGPAQPLQQTVEIEAGATATARFDLP